jgi:hypothetical protein
MDYSRTNYGLCLTTCQAAIDWCLTNHSLVPDNVLVHLLILRLTDLLQVAQLCESRKFTKPCNLQACKSVVRLLSPYCSLAAWQTIFWHPG